MKRTGMYVDEATLNRIREMCSHAQKMPVMSLTTGGQTFSGRAWGDVYSAINRAAIDLGLDNGEDDIKFRWGIDTRDGEILDEGEAE